MDAVIESTVSQAIDDAANTTVPGLASSSFAESHYAPGLSDLRDLGPGFQAEVATRRFQGANPSRREILSRVTSLVRELDIALRNGVFEHAPQLEGSIESELTKLQQAIAGSSTGTKDHWEMIVIAANALFQRTSPLLGELDEDPVTEILKNEIWPQAERTFGFPERASPSMFSAAKVPLRRLEMTRLGFPWEDSLLALLPRTKKVFPLVGATLEGEQGGEGTPPRIRHPRNPPRPGQWPHNNTREVERSLGLTEQQINRQSGISGEDLRDITARVEGLIEFVQAELDKTRTFHAQRIQEDLRPSLAEVRNALYAGVQSDEARRYIDRLVKSEAQTILESTEPFTARGWEGLSVEDQSLLSKLLNPKKLLNYIRAFEAAALDGARSKLPASNPPERSRRLADILSEAFSRLFGPRAERGDQHPRIRTTFSPRPSAEQTRAANSVAQALGFDDFKSFFWGRVLHQVTRERTSDDRADRQATVTSLFAHPDVANAILVESCAAASLRMITRRPPVDLFPVTPGIGPALNRFEAARARVLGELVETIVGRDEYLSRQFQSRGSR